MVTDLPDGFLAKLTAAHARIAKLESDLALANDRTAEAQRYFSEAQAQVAARDERIKRLSVQLGNRVLEDKPFTVSSRSPHDSISQLVGRRVVAASLCAIEAAPAPFMPAMLSLDLDGDVHVTVKIDELMIGHESGTARYGRWERAVPTSSERDMAAPGHVVTVQPAPSPSPDIVPGDVVWLRGGSPPMTVESVRQGETAECLWIDAQGMNDSTVAVAALTKVKPT